MAYHSDTLLLGNQSGLAASGNETRSFDLSGYDKGMFALVAASVTNTGSVTPSIQMSPDNGTSWITLPTGVLAAFTAATSTNTTWFQLNPLLVQGCLGLCRVAYTVSGTVSFTGKLYFVGKAD